MARRTPPRAIRAPGRSGPVALLRGLLARPVYHDATDHDQSIPGLPDALQIDGARPRLVLPLARHGHVPRHVGAFSNRLEFDLTADGREVASGNQHRDRRSELDAPVENGVRLRASPKFARQSVVWVAGSPMGIDHRLGASSLDEIHAGSPTSTIWFRTVTKPPIMTLPSSVSRTHWSPTVTGPHPSFAAIVMYPVTPEPTRLASNSTRPQSSSTKSPRAISTGLGDGVAFVPPNPAGPSVNIGAVLPITTSAMTAATRRYDVRDVVLHGPRKSRSCGVLRRPARRRRSPRAVSRPSRRSANGRRLDRSHAVVMPASFSESLRRLRLLESGAQRSGCIVQTRSRSPVRDAERFGHRHQGQAHVVMQHEDRALVEGEPAKGLLQLVTVHNRLDVVGVARNAGVKHTNGRCPPAVARCVRVAGVDKDSEGPCLEAAASRRCGSFRQIVTRAFCSTSSASVGSRRIRLATPSSVSLTWCTRSANASWSPERARSTTSLSKTPSVRWSFDLRLPMMRVVIGENVQCVPRSSARTRSERSLAVAAAHRPPQERFDGAGPARRLDHWIRRLAANTERCGTMRRRVIRSL